MEDPWSLRLSCSIKVNSYDMGCVRKIIIINISKYIRSMYIHIGISIDNKSLDYVIVSPLTKA